MSHWRRTVGGPRRRGRRSARGPWRSIERAATLIGREVPTGALLEWGPGGGANLSACAGCFRRLYGVDISGKNLDECARVLAEHDPAPDFRPVLIGDDPTVVSDAINEPIDVFVSTAVFQHFPSREYGVEVLRVVAGLLAPGGLGCVQIRYDNGREKYQQKHEDYFARHTDLHLLPAGHVLEHDRERRAATAGHLWGEQQGELREVQLRGAVAARAYRPATLTRAEGERSYAGSR